MEEIVCLRKEEQYILKTAVKSAIAVISKSCLQATWTKLIVSSMVACATFG